jgi:hypothetical protein
MVSVQDIVALKWVVPKDKYELVAVGITIATFHLIVAEAVSGCGIFSLGSSGTAMASVAVIMTGIDKGVLMKHLSPLQTDGCPVALKHSPSIMGNSTI